MIDSPYLHPANEDGEYDYYSALLIAQNNLTEHHPELFQLDSRESSDARKIESDRIQREKIRKFVSQFVASTGLLVQGMTAKEVCRRIYQDMAEFSVLTDLITDEKGENEEINVNSWDDVEVRRTNGKAEKVEGFCNPEHARNVMARMCLVAQAQLDYSRPMAEGNLRENTRLVVLTHPVVDASAGVAASIRLLKPAFFKREFFIKSGTISEDEMSFLELAIQHGVSMCFVGTTGSGKTTLMNYLLSTIPNDQRIVTIEHNARELSLVKRDDSGQRINNVVHTITRPHDDPKQNVSQEDLVAKALRLDPNIICVGEMRDSEAYAAEEASLTGHTVVTSLHADSPFKTHLRAAMLSQKKYPLSIDVGLLQACMAFPIVITIRKLEDNSRRVMSITECEVYDDLSRHYNTLFEFGIHKKYTDEKGKRHVDGEHQQVGLISESMAHNMVLAGASFESLKPYSEV